MSSANRSNVAWLSPRRGCVKSPLTAWIRPISRVDATTATTLAANANTGAFWAVYRFQGTNDGVLDLSNVTTLSGAIDDATVNASRVELIASDCGGLIDLRSLTALSIPTDAVDYFEMDVTGGEAVRLDSLG